MVIKLNENQRVELETACFFKNPADGVCRVVPANQRAFAPRSEWEDERERAEQLKAALAAELRLEF
jgi:hypothetical protein